MIHRCISLFFFFFVFVFCFFFFFFIGKVELHGKVLEVEHSVPKRQR